MALPSESMVLYLTGGWYTHIGQRRLRDEVVDGAIDTASCLFRAGVPLHVISSLAFKIRALASYADPPHRRQMPQPQKPGFSPAEHTVMRHKLQTDTDRQPALQCFVNDCLEHVHDVMDLRGLYLHLVHITRMMQLLQVARISGAAAGLLGANPVPPPAAPIVDVAAEWTPPTSAQDQKNKPAGAGKKAKKAAQTKTKKKASLKTKTQTKPKALGPRAAPKPRTPPKQGLKTTPGSKPAARKKTKATATATATQPRARAASPKGKASPTRKGRA